MGECRVKRGPSTVARGGGLFMMPQWRETSRPGRRGAVLRCRRETRVVTRTGLVGPVGQVGLGPVREDLGSAAREAGDVHRP